MKYATRINSFFRNDKNDLIEILSEIAQVDGITHVDLNYPEHFNSNSVDEISSALKKNDLKLNGIAPRFRDEFINGEFTNSNVEISKKAIAICKESIDVCRSLGGETVTIWLGFDGYDYPFQLNYSESWNKIVQAFQEICEYGSDLKISIEYKPYQPRVFSLISTFGDTMMLLNEVNRSNLGVTLDFCHMIMKGENPAFGLCLASEKNKLYGIHLNDGNKLNDDGLMVGTINLPQTFEFLYYLKKSNYDDAIYFDTFPVRENQVLECEANIEMVNKISKSIDELGIEEIQKTIDAKDAISVQKLLLKFIK